MSDLIRGRVFLFGCPEEHPTPTWVCDECRATGVGHWYALLDHSKTCVGLVEQKRITDFEEASNYFGE